MYCNVNNWPGSTTRKRVFGERHLQRETVVERELEAGGGRRRGGGESEIVRHCAAETCVERLVARAEASTVIVLGVERTEVRVANTPADTKKN